MGDVYTSSTPKLKEINFLGTISRKSPMPITITEEIYEEENKNFYEKMIRKSESPVIKNISVSPMSKIKKPLNSSLLLEKNNTLDVPTSKTPTNYTHLPPIHLRKSNYFRYETKNTGKLKKKFSIGKILKAYEEGCKKSENTKSLKQCIGRNSFIAKEYTKEMNWTSERLSEINGFNSDLMKKLYNEMKSSRNIYESEKNKVINDYSTKFVLGNQYRLKSKKKSKQKLKEYFAL